MINDLFDVGGQSRAQISVAQLAKAPILGRVKTRMQPFLSQAQSLTLHRNMLIHIVKSLSACSALDLTLWVTDENPFFDSLREEYAVKCKLQVEGGLGTRLCAISKSHMRVSADNAPNIFQNPLVLIGSDCPTLTSRSLLELSAYITDDGGYDVAIIPATDGGYVAIALRFHIPALFSDIEWGSAKVMQQTLVRAKEAGVKLALAEPLADIDRPEDLPGLKGLGISY